MLYFSFPVLSNISSLLYFTLRQVTLFFLTSQIFLGTFAGLLGRVTSLSCTGSTYNIYILRYFYFRWKLKKWRAILQIFMIRFFAIFFFICYFFFLDEILWSRHLSVFHFFSFFFFFFIYESNNLNFVNWLGEMIK